MTLTRRRKSRSKSKTRSRSSKPLGLDSQIVGAFVKSGVTEENARILATTLLTFIGTYDTHPRVAAKAQEAGEVVAEQVVAADPVAVRAALNEAAADAVAAQKQKGGSPIRWNRTVVPGLYTTATAAMWAVGFASVQAIKRVLVAAGCDSRIVNVACYMIPCLLHALPEVFAPGVVPGLSYAPYAGPAPMPHEHAD
jgi:hypothetical protein